MGVALGVEVNNAIAKAVPTRSTTSIGIADFNSVVFCFSLKAHVEGSSYFRIYMGHLGTEGIERMTFLHYEPRM